MLAPIHQRVGQREKVVQGYIAAYRTVRAWSSTGAPERTAAGVSRPGSLPSMTRIGTGEKLLQAASASCLESLHSVASSRCPVIHGDVVIRVVFRLPRSRSFLSDHITLADFAAWRLGGGGGRGGFIGLLVGRGVGARGRLESRESWCSP
jgi:hypothetical protein